MANLKNDFDARKGWDNYRASAVFPLIIDDGNDTTIVFQDYWAWKSKLSEKMLLITLREDDGSLIGKKYFAIETHNEISIKKEFSLDFCRGTVEAEIISTGNLKIPFPALICAYSNTTIQSVSFVHSAGRKLNPSESVIQCDWDESNFLCKFDEDFEPFIHLFFGNYCERSKETVYITALSDQNEVLLEKEISIISKPHGGKILYLKDHLSDQEKGLLNTHEFFLRIKYRAIGIFGRLVVGNYHRGHNCYFVTHSFKYIDANQKDFTDAPSGLDATSLLSIINSPPLSVTTKNYPTTNPSTATFKSRSAKLGERLSDDGGKKTIITGGDGSSVWKQKIEGGQLKVWHADSNVASRIAVNYGYKLPNSLHPTDIATGFKSHVYPSKVSHWGHGVNLKGWETYLLFRNLSHIFSSTTSSEVRLSLLSEHGVEEFPPFELAAESASCIRIGDLSKKTSSQNFLSWKAISSQGTVDCFFVSFNEQTGMVCGEHAF